MAPYPTPALPRAQLYRALIGPQNGQEPPPLKHIDSTKQGPLWGLVLPEITAKL